MMLLPKDVGPFTLLRKLGTGTVAESYLGTLHGSGDGDGGRPVVVRRILPFVLRDPARLASTEARVRDLIGVRHPFLVRVLDWVEHDGERFIVEERVEGVDLDRVLAFCRQQETPIPGNVFLHLATQICNGLEALHGRPGRGTGADSVLHLGLRPGAILVGREGKVVLGGFGLTRSPMAMSHGGPGSPVSVRMEYLSPEQTQGDKRLSPASDIFSLGAVLYELLTREPLFRSESNLQTIHRIRKAEVTSELLRVKELMPGLDKVLYRALSLDPRHRYQRAFVLREDLRGLMAGYSFNSILEDARTFFAPLIQDAAPPPGPAAAAPSVPAPSVPAPSVPAPSVPAPSAPEPPPIDAFDDEEATRIDAVPEPEPEAAPEVPAPSDPAPDVPAPPPVPVQVGPSGPAPDTTAAFIEQSASGELAPSGPEDLFDEDSASEDLFNPADLPAADVPETTRAFIDEVPSAADLPGEDEEELSERRTLPVPPMSADLPPEEPPTDINAAAPPPVPAAAAPKATPTPPAPAVPPPAVPGVASPRDNSAGSPPVPSQAPAAQAVEPPATPAPAAAAAAPAPVSSDDDFDDLDYKPGGNKTLMMVAVGVAALVVVCGGGIFGAVRYVQGQADAAFDQVADALEEAAAEEAAAVGAAAEAGAEEPPATGDGTEDGGPDGARGGDLAALDEAPTRDVAAAEPTPAPRAERSRPAPAPRPASTGSADRGSSASTGRTSSSSASPSATGSSDRVRPAPTPLRPSSGGASSAASSSAGPDSLDIDGGDAVADAGADEGIDPAELDRYSSAAAKGRLSPSDVMSLETVAVTDPAYSRSRALLLMHAQAKGDERGAAHYLDELMVLPENQYNPVYLSEQARIDVNQRRYARALEKARLAERYWARLPPDLVFSKKAEIYETQAAALQGSFYASEDDLELLDDAVRHWKKYRDHVQTRSRSDLATRADAEIAKLEDIRRRLQ